MLKEENQGDGITDANRVYLTPITKLTNPEFDSLMRSFPSALDATHLKDILAKTQERETLESWETVGLFEAISAFENFINDKNGESFDFFQMLLPSILGWASETYSISCMQIPLLEQITSFDTDNPTRMSQLNLNRKEIRGILANCFLLNLDHVHGQNYGNLSLHRLYHSSCSESVNRILCFLSYFYQINSKDEAFMMESVVFERHAQRSADKTFINEEKPLLEGQNDVHIHTERMENSDAKLFVDFANSQPHIGRVIPSLTQEEILFSCCPELFVCILFAERLNENEVLIARNVIRFSEYTGYLRTFNFVDFYDECGAQYCSNIVVLDAVYSNHFRAEKIIRDINKAILGFSASGVEKVSTGHWGCGIFGGDETAKFVQQLVAANGAGVQLDYSTFKNQKQMQAFIAIKHALIENKVSVGHICYLMFSYEKEKGEFKTFQNYLFDELRIPRAECTEEANDKYDNPTCTTH